MSRRASNPAWIRGWRVLTRPSIISGNPVISATSLTGRFALRSVAAVPPVEMISHPRSIRPRAKPTIPRLSLTDIKARGIGPLSGRFQPFEFERHRSARLGGALDRRGKQPMLHREHSGRQGLGGIPRLDL